LAASGAIVYDKGMNSIEQLINDLPGHQTIRKGLSDFAANRKTIESYLIQIGSPKLQRAGIAFEGTIDPDADHKLYYLLGETYNDDAHTEYNEWLRHLVIFEHALERRMSRHRVQPD
jgi:hypothetical protein